MDLKTGIEFEGWNVKPAELAYFAILLLVGLAVYWGIFRIPFIYDDFPHLFYNYRLQQARNLKEILRSGFQETRPLFLLSMAVTYFSAGLKPTFYHIFSLALHFSNALLLFCLVQFFILARHHRPRNFEKLAPFFISAIFLIHPLQTESVSYINSRSGLLMTFFVLFAMVLMVSFRISKKPWERALCYAGVIFSLVCSMLSKENGCVGPLLILLMDRWIIPQNMRHEKKSQTVLIHSGIWATLVTIPLLFIFFQNPHYKTIGFSILDKWQFWMTQPRVLSYFIGSFFLPLSQNIDYDFSLTKSFFDWHFLAATSFIFGLAFLAWRLRKIQPMIALGICWFFIGIAPTNSVVPFFDFVAERHLYLPLIGLAIAVIYSLQLLLESNLPIKKIKPRLIYGLLLAWIVSLSILTMQRNQVWQSEIDLWSDSAAKSPNKARPFINLGSALALGKHFDEAEIVLKRALALDPNSAPANYNLAGIYTNRHQIDLATQRLLDTLRLNPAHGLARISLAKIYVQQGNMNEAILLLQRGIGIYGHDELLVRLYAGRFLLLTNRLSEAKTLLLEAIKIYPAFPKLYFELTKVLIKIGDEGAAKTTYRKGLYLRNVPESMIDPLVNQLMSKTAQHPFL